MRKEIVLIFLTASLSIAGTLAIQKINDKTRYLEYKIDTFTNVFTKPESVNKRLRLYLDSLEVVNISILRLTIYNTSGEALEKLNLSYELFSKSKNRIDIVEENFYGQGKNKDFVSGYSSISENSENSKQKINCVIKVANKLGYNEPVFAAEYVFKNDEIPEIKNVSFINSRIQCNLLDFDGLLKRKEMKNSLIAFMIALIIIFSAIFVSTFIGKKKEYKKRLKLLEFLTIKMKTEHRDDFDKLENPVEFLSFIENKKREYNDSKIPKLIKKISNLEEPKAIDKNDIEKIFSRYK